ncbi:FHA domain-containing protein FhaB/FipA [Nocardioides mesophilus]|uniref:FHA domain-containing protein FhaB/FipA n=1 Tax=Nocardioides mesophilus TaxID=433659 RepID=UPI0024842CD5|nr:FHA domain-containing protein [Nocardioides mesophilus]
MDLRSLRRVRGALRHVRRPRGRRPRADRRDEKRSRKQARGKPAKRPRGAPTHVAITEGANAGENISLDLAPLLIGRGSDAAIRLDDDYVSTRHARIASSEDQWFVEDLGSTNGTYIGSTRLTQPTTLTLGTKIRIGKTTLELRK